MSMEGRIYVHCVLFWFMGCVFAGYSSDNGHQGGILRGAVIDNTEQTGNIRGTFDSSHNKGPIVVNNTRPCPCANTTLCNRITWRAKREVYVFGGLGDWSGYDWKKPTTVVEHGPHMDDRICMAHAHGVRLAMLATYPTHLLPNATCRSQWIEWMIGNVTYNFLDGINVDFEGSIPAGRKDLTDGLTALVQELSDRLRKIYPHTQITADYPFIPNYYDRYYDYKSVTDVMDFVFLMDYDMPSGTGFVGANSGYVLVLRGILQYIKLGIDPYKLILGVPWYGYNHKCAMFNMTTGHCGGGADYDDFPTVGAAPVGYSMVVQDILPMSYSGRLWDEWSRSPYCNLRNPKTGDIYQVWYDDAESTQLKYLLAQELGLRGVGLWQASGVNYSDPRQVQDMWGALP